MININKIRGLRAESNVSQKDISKFLNISPNAYWKKENNFSEFSFDEACKLADFFHVKIDDLRAR